jgi:hypothetical protein
MDQDVLNWVFGALMAIIGWFGKTLWDASSAVRRDLHAIERDLPAYYLKKDEFRDTIKELKEEHRSAMREIKDICDKIFNKLDSKVDKGGQ